jgi:hypothetical protein
MRVLGFCSALLVLAASQVSAEYRLVSDLVSTGAIEGQGDAFRLQGSIGGAPSGRVGNPPWTIQQGFWFLWRGVTGIEMPEAPPQSFDLQLDQNAPNPFNPVTRITFTVPGRPGEFIATRLDVVDVGGRLVCVLVDSSLPSGVHEVVWSGQGRDGQIMGSGVYFYRLRTGDQIITRRLVMVK